MYDSTDPIQVAALRAEVFDNLVHYGDPGLTRTILDKLNTQTADATICRTPTNSTTRQISEDDLMASTLTDASEFEAAMLGGTPPNTALEAIRAYFLRHLLDKEDELVPQRFMNTLYVMFDATIAPTINAAIHGYATGPKCQGEVNWGEGTNISESEWIEARGPNNPDGSWPTTAEVEAARI